MSRPISITGLLVSLTLPLAAQAQFTAYNDFCTEYVASATNVTQNQNAGTYALKDYATGAIVTPTMTITRHSGLGTAGTGPTAEISGGDALTIFGGKVAGKGTCMNPTTGWYFNMEFSGLDVNKTYNVATFTDRGNPSYDNKRWANISLVNADSTTATYAGSVGVGNYQISPTSVSQDSGYNTTEGFVAMWTGIAPGPDGKFSIYLRAATTAEVPAAYQGIMSQNSGYGPAGLMLQEVPGNAVDISPGQINTVVGGATVIGTVKIPAGSNADGPVQVTLTNDNPAAADLVGATGGVLVLTFPQGGATEQSIQIDIGQAGSATITSTNDAGLLNDTLPVTVQTGAVTVNPTSISTLPNSIRPLTVSISAGANDTRPIQVVLRSNNPAAADLVGSTGGVLALTFEQGAANSQTVDVQLGAVAGETTTIDVSNDGGLTDPGAITVSVVNLRSWVIPIAELHSDSGQPSNPARAWQMVATGGYDSGGPYTGTYPLDGRYYWRTWDADIVWQQVYWRFDAPDVSSRPRLYSVECWVPYLGPDDPRSWKQIDVKLNGTVGEGTNYNTEMVPRNSHNQWIKKGQLETNETEGGWKPAGPGPNAPDGPECGAGSAGSYMWLKRGSMLYMDGNTTAKYGVSALRITEVESVAPVCDPPVSDGPIDLRCAGNSDPLYTVGEPFGTGYEGNIDGNTLGVEGYRWPCNEGSNNILPLSGGLPYDSEHSEYATYTAQLPTGNVSFKLRYDGLNTMKWRNDTTGDFSKYREFTLNEVPDRDFVSGYFGRMYVLSTKGGGNSGKLRVEKIYGDGSSDVTEAQLYDWFNQDGDAGSMAVGVDGRLRSAGTDVVGFTRLNNWGLAPNPSGTSPWQVGNSGGDHGGAFLFVHPIDIDRTRTLTQVKIGVGDSESFGGELVVMAMTFEARPCSVPVFDAVGGGPDGLAPDGAVDQSDFGVFQACYGGNALLSDEDMARCRCFDVTGDRKIDGDDLVRFEECATGPGIGPPPAGCDQP